MATSEDGLLQQRFRRGVEMLYDRICPQGGWTAGNGVVYGIPLAPHPDATSIALLALRGVPLNAFVTASLDWLERRAQFCFAPWSLAWGILALTAFRRTTQTLVNRLPKVVESDAIDDSPTLPFPSPPLNSPNALNPFP